MSAQSDLERWVAANLGSKQAEEMESLVGRILTEARQNGGEDVQQLRAAVLRLEGMVAELAEAADERGIRNENFRLWARGKLVGGSILSLGPATPKACEMVAAYRDWRSTQN